VAKNKTRLVSVVAMRAFCLVGILRKKRHLNQNNLGSKLEFRWEFLRWRTSWVGIPKRYELRWLSILYYENILSSLDFGHAAHKTGPRIEYGCRY